MVVLGVVLLVLALIVPVLHVLFWIGVALIVVGLLLWLAGSTGHAVGGRRHYY
jgi:membrane protein implicated in regulation of membrane protease activity